MKKIFTAVLFSCLTSFLWSQSEVFNIDDTPDYAGCDAIMHDDNGGLVPYSPGANNEILICSADITEQINLFFIGFNLSPGDTLYIYDGFDATAPFIGAFSGESLLFETVSATGPCLTVRFVANGDPEVGDFSARIICGTPCDFPIADLQAVEAGVVLPDTVKICPGESVDFDASNSIWTSGATANLTWNFGDGTEVTNQNTTNSHVFSEPGGYRVRLRIEDSNDCQSLNLPEVIVFVSTPYNFDLTASSTRYCIGNEVLIGTQAYVDTTATIGDESDNGGSDTWVEEVSIVFENGIYIPDNQGCLDSEIEFTQFGGEVIDDANDFSSIYFNIEHSFVGDITIRVICPNGQTMSIFPEAGGSGTYLGEPIDDVSGGPPGVGFDYSFSPNSTGGTWMELIDGGGVIDNTIPAGDYEPEGSFDDLIGCPLNGTWTLEICDIVGIDDGNLFEFGIQFAPIFYPEALQFTPIVGNGCDSSYWVNPSVFTSIGDNCDWAIFNPTSPGLYTFEYEVLNDFGCQFNDSITIEVVNVPVVTVADLNVCTEDAELEAVIQNFEAGLNYTYSWSPANLLSGAGTSSPTVNNQFNQSPTTFGVTVSIQDFDNCSSLTPVNVVATPPVVTVNGGTTHCEESDVPLNAQFNAIPGVTYSYLWTSDSGQSFSNTQSVTLNNVTPGTIEYDVVLTANGFNLCRDTASSSISVVHDTNIGATPTPICEAEFPLLLEYLPQDNPDLTYGWERNASTINGEFGDTLLLEDPQNGDGVFTLVITNDYCGTDRIDFVVAPPLMDTTYILDPCIEEPAVELYIEDQSQYITQNQAVTYAWTYTSFPEDGSVVEQITAGTSHLPELPGYYDVVITQATPGCTGTALVRFDYRPEPCILLIPNIITPNGDGENDTFNVLSISRYAGSTCQIFNRWGNLVFEDLDYDGSWSAVDIPDGVYYYVVGVKRSSGMEYHSGDLTILR
jgi:gliding motility-associated-like protein